jgi:hypothetical protein
VLQVAFDHAWKYSTRMLFDVVDKVFVTNGSCWMASMLIMPSWHFACDVPACYGG